MKAMYECLPCLLRQVIRVANYATSDKSLQLKVFEKALFELNYLFDLNGVPAELGTTIHRFVSQALDNPDPYREEKHISNLKALELLPDIQEIISSSSAPFQVALKAALAGNSVDFAVGKDYNIESEFEKALNEKFAIDETEVMLDLLNKSKNIFYIFDNAAEIVFDRLLIEQIKRQFKVRVIGAVKGDPILNDATIEDAQIAGITEVIDELITTGTNTIGTILEECSTEFIQKLKSADLVICKGMGNYESLGDSSLQQKIVFILKAKCNPVATNLGVALNSNVVKVL